MQQYKDFKNLHNFVLATSTQTGVDARTIHAIEINDKFVFLTSKDSQKVSEISANNNVCLFHSFMDEKGFTEQRLFATLKENAEFDLKSYKEAYLAKYPYMQSSVDHVLTPFEDKVIFEIKPSSLRIVTQSSNDTYNF